MIPNILRYILRLCVVRGCLIVGEGLSFMASSSAVWAQATLPTPIAPPVAYPPNTWQGKGSAVIRVLDRLESHVDLLTIPVNAVYQYKNLMITVGRCLQRPPTLAPDAAAWLDIQDTLHKGVTFHGWMLAAEPSLGILEDPFYDVQVVRCDGEDLPPNLPPLPQPVVPHLPMASSSISIVSDKVPDTVVQTTKAQSAAQPEKNTSFSSRAISVRGEMTLSQHTRSSSLSIQEKQQNREEIHSVLSLEKGKKLPPPVPFSTPFSTPWRRHSGTLNNMPEKGGIY